MKRLVVTIMLTIMGSLSTNLFQPPAAGAATVVSGEVSFYDGDYVDIYKDIFSDILTSLGSISGTWAAYRVLSYNHQELETFVYSLTNGVAISEHGPETFIKASFSGSNFYSGARGAVEAAIEYDFYITKNDDKYPDDWIIPLVMIIRTNLRGYEYGSSFAQVLLKDGALGDAGVYQEVVWANSFNRPGITAWFDKWDAPVGMYKTLKMYAGVSNWGYSEYSGYPHYAAASVVLDPLIYIDPDAMVEYEGKMVPLASMYSVKFPGMPTRTTPPTNPGALFLLLDD